MRIYSEYQHFKLKSQAPVAFYETTFCCRFNKVRDLLPHHKLKSIIDKSFHVINTQRNNILFEVLFTLFSFSVMWTKNREI